MLTRREIISKLNRTRQAHQPIVDTDDKRAIDQLVDEGLALRIGRHGYMLAHHARHCLPLLKVLKAFTPNELKVLRVFRSKGRVQLRRGELLKEAGLKVHSRTSALLQGLVKKKVLGHEKKEDPYEVGSKWPAVLTLPSRLRE